MAITSMCITLQAWIDAFLFEASRIRSRMDNHFTLPKFFPGTVIVAPHSSDQIKGSGLISSHQPIFKISFFTRFLGKPYLVDGL